MIKIRKLILDDLNGLIMLLEQLWVGKHIDYDSVKKKLKKDC
jgi:hypothetical protein